MRRVKQARYVIDGDCIVDAIARDGVLYDGLRNPDLCNFTEAEAQALVQLLNQGYDKFSWEEIEPLVMELAKRQ